MIAGRKIAIVPVLRAGLAMADGLRERILSAREGHIGLYRAADHLDPDACIVPGLGDAGDRLYRTKH